jgi:hypothetical protein
MQWSGGGQDTTVYVIGKVGNDGPYLFDTVNENFEKKTYSTMDHMVRPVRTGADWEFDSEFANPSHLLLYHRKGLALCPNLPLGSSKDTYTVSDSLEAIPTATRLPESHPSAGPVCRGYEAFRHHPFYSINV